MQPWSAAWEQALYGADGFFRRERPADHFRTSVGCGPAYADAVRALADRVDAALGRPDPFDLVDVGAGHGELLTQVALAGVPARWRLTAVERAAHRSGGLRWTAEVPELTGLLFANEWLDSVPLDVLDDDRLVLVAADGEQRPGPPAPAGLRAWRAHWWPGRGRAEVGLSRDRALAAAVRRVRRGVAVAVDYGHLRATRRETLTGYRRGRQVPPVPDGTRDLTAHVALDSCAAASGGRLLPQHLALRALGVTVALPQWGGDPVAYAGDLERASASTVLLDPAGLGGFTWLVREVGTPAVLPVGGAGRST